MTLEDIRQMASTVAPIVREYVEQATSPLVAQVGELRKALSDAEAAAQRKAVEHADDLAKAATHHAEQLDAATARAAAAETAATEGIAALRAEFAPLIEEARTAYNYLTDVAPLKAEVDAVREQVFDLTTRELVPGEKGDPGDPGAPGRDGLDASEDQIAKAVADYIAANPPASGRDGEPGAAGKDADEAQIAVAVAEYLDANPPAAGQDGAPGEQGRPGEKGDPGQNGKDAEVDYDRLAVEVAKHIPAPENGKDADPEVVASMIADAVAKAVGALPVAKDGIGMAGAMIDRAGALIITMTDGTIRELGLVVGKDGEPGLPGADGLPGKDGFSLEDFEAEVKDGGRTLVLSFVAGDVKHTSEHQLDTILDRGVFKVGSTYQSGDAVTWDGSLWIAQAKTKSRPGENAEWRLAAKRGQNGKDVNESALKAQIEEHVRAAEERLAARIEAGFKRRDG